MRSLNAFIEPSLLNVSWRVSRGQPARGFFAAGCADIARKAMACTLQIFGLFLPIGGPYSAASSSKVQTLESGKQERQQVVATHGAFPRDHLPQPRSDRNWLGETFHTWKELAAAVSLIQQGRGMVRNNWKLRRQCKACREMRLGYSECLAFVSV